MKKFGLNTLILGSLLSGTAIGVNAATLNATYNGSTNQGVWSDFTIEFTDTNGNNILDVDEVSLPLSSPDFSGVNDVGNSTFYSILTAIPVISGITDGFVNDEGNPETNWGFSTGSFGRSPGTSPWDYEITTDAVVPEPMTILGTGVVLAFLPQLKKQTKKN